MTPHPLLAFTLFLHLLLQQILNHYLRAGSAYFLQFLSSLLLLNPLKAGIFPHWTMNKKANGLYVVKCHVSSWSTHSIWNIWFHSPFRNSSFTWLLRSYSLILFILLFILPHSWLTFHLLDLFSAFLYYKVSPWECRCYFVSLISRRKLGTQ